MQLPDLDFFISLGKLVFIFASMLVMLRFKCQLWQAIMAGCALAAGIALLTGAEPLSIALVPVEPFRDSNFLLMQVMIFGIMLLSGLQVASGQNQRLVEALDRYLRWPRLRLVIFPALVGLLPMPGGALFSCPMLDAAAHGLDLSPKRKTLINYWFRHIWETAWPLYPGFILVCQLVNIPISALMRYTFPLVLFSIAIGWVFFIRNIQVPPAPPREEQNGAAHPLFAALYESLPISITILGAAIFGVILSKAAPSVPSQAAFIFSLGVAVLVAFLQGRGRFSAPLAGLVLNRRTLGMMLLIYMIFVFKDMVGASGIISGISHAGSSFAAIALLCILLPLICGMLTGVMVGYVGAAFPIILAIIAEAGLEAYAVPLIILGISSGQIGQLATPLHICIVVTCEYYKIHFNDIWRAMLRPLACLLMAGLLWVGLLFGIGARF